jgi:tRNA 2-thiouridine synthesizing protein B
MTMLHIIRSSAYSGNTLELCLSTIAPDDDILLMDDGCYNLTHPLLHKAIEKLTQGTIFYLADHTNARAITPSYSKLTAIDVNHTPELIFKHENAINWT